MGKVFLIDIAQCNGCYNCQIVCKDEHCGNDWRPYAAPQPDTGHFWMRINEKTRGQVPVVKVSYQPIMCQHCEKCPLLELGAADGAVYRRDDGLVVIDPEKAAGRQDLVDACPLGCVFWNAELSLPQKCTGCAHLLDNGWDVPRCVDACAHNVIRWVDEDSDEAKAFIAEAELIDQVAGLAPRTYYKNLPKRFIAGAVVDLGIDELLIGAPVKIEGKAGYSAQMVTDEFGDFMFNQIPADVYTLTVCAEGYKELAMEVDVTAIDKTVGDLAVEK